MSPKVMGIDPGSRRIGVAVSDPEGKIAMPKSVVDRRGKRFMDELSTIARDNAVSEIVVGLPMNMDGSEGPSARSARLLADELAQELNLPVKLLDERLTTVSAKAAMRSGGASSREQRGTIDKVAANIDPPELSRFEARLKRFGLVMLALALAGLAGAGALYRWVNYQGQANGDRVSVFIEQGTSGKAIAEKLEEKRVVSSALAFRIYLRTRNVNSDLRAGKYELQTAMAFEDLVAELKKGPEVKFVKLVVPEGLTVDQTALQVEKLTHIKAADFLAAARPDIARPSILPPGVQTLEGFLYPATYFVIEQETAEGLVKRMVGEFEKRSKAVGIDQAGALQRTPFEVLVIASMIEEEAKENEERDEVSAVIHNRLRKGIPLGIDATIQYAVKKYHGEPLTESDLAIDSPFNSRLRQGLPPWPIASPRDKSIKAALNPAKVDFLYYVLKDCKTHLFTADYEEFSRAKQRIPTNC